MLDISKIIDGILAEEKDFIYGFADLKGLVHKKFKGYDYAVSIGRKLDNGIIDGIENGPTPEYYEHYYSINKILQETVNKISERLNDYKIDNFPVKPTVTDEELDKEEGKTLTALFSHKMAATRAGLGWIGKTDLFVSKKFGPRLRLAAVLVREKLPVPEFPINESLCGQCDLCVVLCPAEAANGKLWNTGMKREDFYNADRCRKKCRELTLKNTGRNESLCGICVSVCPVGKGSGK